MGCSTSARTSITSPRRIPVGTRTLAAPTSIVISAAPVDGDAHVGRGAPQRAVGRFDDRPDGRRHPRSEEHTSELQSPLNISYAVFCLKKKKKKKKKKNKKKINKQTNKY